jgi:peptidoglycan/LPS O-acetylase OafA/YrhL
MAADGRWLKADSRQPMPHTPALDGVRGIAILLVLVHHFTVFAPAGRFEAALASVALLGWSGVDLFFVLSGFLITGILIDARGSNRYFSSFYARRSLRIFPLYFLMVFLSFAVLPQFPSLNLLLVGPTDVPQWPYWTYLVNFAIAERNQFLHGVLDIAWSLAIEEQFYLVWAVVVWGLAPRWLGPLCAFIVLLAPALRILAVGGGTEPISVYVLPHFRADTLALGGLLAWQARRDSLGRVARIAPYVFVAAVLGAIAAAVVEASPWWWEPAMQRFGYSLFALAGGALIVTAVTRPTRSLWQSALSASWLRACGRYSYCMYLVHLPVSRILQEYGIAARDFPTVLGAAWPAQIAYYFIASVLTFAIGWLSWRVFEAPILRLKARFPYV